MPTAVSYPGVYIEEFTPGAPIQGVGTSVAGFIGISDRGEPNRPERITSWTRFLEVFGPEPVRGFFLWHAVRGFFENGGRDCFVVRASNGSFDTWRPLNRAGDPMMSVRARRSGSSGLQIVIAASHHLNGATLYRPDATVGSLGPRTLVMQAAGAVSAEQAAAQFRPGDLVTFAAIDYGILQVVGASIQVDRDIPNATLPAAVRLADIGAGSASVRLRVPTAFDPRLLTAGTILSFSQGTGANLIQDSQVVSSVVAEVLALPGLDRTYRVGLRSALTQSFRMTADTAVSSEEFSLTVRGGATAIPFTGLSIEPTHPAYYVDRLNSEASPVLVEAIEPAPATATIAQSLPDAGTVALLSSGTAEDLQNIGDGPFLDALDALRPIDDVNLIAAPDCRTTVVQQALITQCELLADRFAILDPPDSAPPFGAGTTSIEAVRRNLASTRGYAALYYPWLRVPPARSGRPVLVPPSGHICGIIARSDAANGVHKAPANEIIRGAVDVERLLSDTDQGVLNLQGINVIRVFGGGGRPVLWGARTTATDRNWQYVNVRRLFLFLEESIQEGIAWAVFQPNTYSLWQNVKRTITEFLTRVWRDGGLFGRTAADAFYVRIDDAINPFSEQALGRLNIEIGVRPTYPAEFIIVRIGIWPGGSEISEQA